MRLGLFPLLLLGCSGSDHVPTGQDPTDPTDPETSTAAGDISEGALAEGSEGPTSGTADNTSPTAPFDASSSTTTTTTSSTGGSEDGGPPPGEDCASYPYQADVLLAERLGFGAATSGGDPTYVVLVASLADDGEGSLREALTSPDSAWIAFDVEGVIELDSPIEIASNKTVDGRGRDITIHGHLRLESGTHDVILSDIALSDPGADDGGPDLIQLRGGGGADPSDFDTHDVWFHHLGLSHAGDGLIDIRGATAITLSWSHLFDHTKALLHWQDTEGGDAAGMRVTYHHNWFDHITRRGPQFHYGLADYFNNYQEQWYEFGATSQEGAQFLSEANIYEARPGEVCLPACPDPSPHGGGNDFFVSKRAVVSGWDNTKGRILSVNDLALNDAVIEQFEPEQVFTRADYYDAQPEPADEALRAAIVANAGPRVDYCR